MAARASSLRWVWFFGLTSLFLLLALAVYLLPLKPNLVALQFAFDPSTFAAVLAAWQPEGVALFRSHFPVDYVLLVCYGVFGYLLVSQTAVFAGAPPGQLRLLPWMLPVAAVGDATENTLHLILTAGAAHTEPLLYLLAGLGATVKFVLLVAFFVLLARQRAAKTSRTRW